MFRKLIFIAPTLVFAALVAMFVAGLQNNPRDIPSMLINKEVPAFVLDPLPGETKGLSSADLLGDVSLVNIFGSWCVACIAEHPELVRIKDSGFVKIYGIDWREKDPKDGRRWLERNGNPYTLVGLDPDSKVAIDFGVTGAPETFVVDRQGVVRYKHVGPITPDVWEQTLKPMITELRK